MTGKYWAKHLSTLGVAVDGSSGGKGGGEGRWSAAGILECLPGVLPKPETRNPKIETQHQKLDSRNQKSEN